MEIIEQIGVQHICNGVGHPATKGDVIIGNDVCISDGAVITNNSHVVKDIDPAKLLEITWWGLG